MADTTEKAGEGAPEASAGAATESAEIVEAPAPEAPAAEALAAEALAADLPAPATAEASTAATPRVVFVETPAPPRDKGNRLLGGLLAVLGGAIFALVNAIAVLIWLASVPSALSLFPGVTGSAAAFTSFLGSAYFWVPVLFFTLGFVVLTLVLNRAGWWLHIAGSILVALFTLYASIGTLLLLDGILFQTGGEAAATYWSFALDPRLLIGALVARETAIWVGLAIAARGRRVKIRNAERRATFEKELEQKKAEHERAAAVA